MAFIGLYPIIKKVKSACWIFFLFISASCVLFADEFDEELAGTLKIEANHNINRLKSLKADEQNNKVFQNEREKGLGEFLEDQEKWDLYRERGLADYRRDKRSYQTPVEGGFEYEQDQNRKRQAEFLYEQSRKIHARTRQKIEAQTKYDIGSLEMEELGLNQKLPRYDLRKRGRNKWSANLKPGGGGSAFSPGFQNAAPPVEFPPAPDFPAAPAPYEGYDDSQNIPPPPPPPVYDSGNGGVPYDSYGGELAIPPPPPPPPDYDF